MATRDLLVVGFDASAIAASASRLGHTVYAVDYFGDRDTMSVTKMNLFLSNQIPQRSNVRIEKRFSPARLVKQAKKLAQIHSIDGILLGSGLEDAPQELEALKKLAPILGNPISILAKVRDKISFFTTLTENQIRCPETALVGNYWAAEKAARGMGYPVIVKPLHGFGGTGIKFAQNKKALQSSIAGEGEALVQKFIHGTAASASVIGTGRESTVLTINEQILGDHQLGAQNRFTYCGNIVPLDAQHDSLKRCQSISTEVSNIFGLIGSNGIDFVLDEFGIPWVVEVNPRFQGTIECIESVLRINVVEAHLEACHGTPTEPPRASQQFSTRLVLYGRRRCSIPDLSSFAEIRDIPFQEVIVEKGEPVCSLVTGGRTETECIQVAKGLAKRVYSLLRPNDS